VRIHGSQGPVQPVPASVPPAPPEGAQILWEDDPDVSTPRSSRMPPALLLLVGGAIGLGVIVLTLMARGGGDTPESSPLPAAGVVQRGVLNAFRDLDSLHAEFEISRLSVYRLPGEADDDERAMFSFSLASEAGRIVYEKPDRLREERTLEIPDAAPIRSTTVRTATGELQTLVIEPADRAAEIIDDPALGPPSVDLVPVLGRLESSISVPAKLLAEANPGDVEVLGETTVGETRAYRVRFPAEPNPLTRADRFEMVLDAQTYFPLRVIRSISRLDAQVLGPEELLTSDAIDTAFATNDRMTVERIDLTSLELNGVALPGEFVLEPPSGVEPDETSAGFEVTDPEALVDLAWDVLVPSQVPEGFQRRQTVASTERLTGWGPRNRYPVPTGIVQTLYFDDATTVVVDQRHVRRGPVAIDTSPMPGTTMPMTERRLPGSDFTYAISPEVPPHVYGWVDDVFVMVSGYAPASQLLAFAESMQAPEPSPTPESDGSPSPSPQGTARATASPRPTP
jgi:hypothetical protein